MEFQEIPWLLLTAGLTGFGLLATWLVGRRRGAAAVMRGIAWSLVPIAAYLTGLIEVAWKLGAAVATWALQLVFSPLVWAGIIVAGLCAVLFVVSGVLRRRGLAGAGRAAGQAVEPGRDAGKELDRQPSGAKATKQGATADDDFAEIEDILRRRGIS